MTIEEFEAKMKQPRFDESEPKYIGKSGTEGAEALEVHSSEPSFWSKLKSKLTKA
jgi:hypothetical protein